ncbi:MAG: hypothetical protein J5792_06570 [Bacteroidales bacterium]|nr:hypothetical protein [Bacteroidales bacterium]
MKYQVKVTQTISKFFSVEADDEHDAFEKAQAMVEEGEIRFDDEPFLRMDMNVEIVR